MRSSRTPKKTKRPKVAVPESSHRRVLVHDADGARIMPAHARILQRCMSGPTVDQVEWVERHADGFDRLAVLIETANYMNARRDIDPEAANHVAVSITMLRNELRGLRARLWP